MTVVNALIPTMMQITMVMMTMIMSDDDDDSDDDNDYDDDTGQTCHLPMGDSPQEWVVMKAQLVNPDEEKSCEDCHGPAKMLSLKGLQLTLFLIVKVVMRTS